jgi:hypothetical protein
MCSVAQTSLKDSLNGGALIAASREARGTTAAALRARKFWQQRRYAPVSSLRGRALATAKRRRGPISIRQSVSEV